MADWHLGLTQAVLSQLHQPWAIGPGTGVGVGFPVMERTHLRLGLSWRRLWDDTTSENSVKLPHPGSRAERAWTQILLSAQMERLFGGPPSLSLFGTAGLGVSFWRIERYPDYDAIAVTDANDKAKDYSATEAVLSFALGIQPRLVSSLRLRAQLGVDYFTGIGTDFADTWNDERSRAQLWLVVGVSLPLGGGVRPQPETYDFAATPPAATDENAVAPPLKAAAPSVTVDTDNDGVPDSKDQCPATPSGAIVDRRGCPLDADGDGVYDGLDRCPGTPSSLRAYVDSFGCPKTDAIPSIPIEKKTVILTESSPADTTPVPHVPPAAASTAPAESVITTAETDTAMTTEAVAPADTTVASVASEDSLEAVSETENRRPSLTIGTTPADSDGDGVADSQDWCPNTLKGLPVDQHGCLVMTELQRRVILYVSYLPGTTAPDRTSLAVLDDLIVRLKRAPDVQVTIEGFTDNIGRDDDNLAVSQKRADRIKEYLVEKGIAGSRVTAIGRGETDFIADNATAAGRQKNRRIEISFARP